MDPASLGASKPAGLRIWLDAMEVLKFEIVIYWI